MNFNCDSEPPGPAHEFVRSDFLVEHIPLWEVCKFEVWCQNKDIVWAIGEEVFSCQFTVNNKL